MTPTPPAKPFTLSASPSTARPLSPTSRPIGSINKHPDLRPITATVPVTRWPPHPPQGPEREFCEAKMVRGVQWPTTQRGEIVDRPCPKGSLGNLIYLSVKHLRLPTLYKYYSFSSRVYGCFSHIQTKVINVFVLSDLFFSTVIFLCPCAGPTSGHSLRGLTDKSSTLANERFIFHRNRAD